MEKLHHPCFFDYFDYGRACGGFQLAGGPFCLFRSGDIFSGPRDVFSAWLKGGIDHNNMPVLSSSACRGKMLDRTIGIELELKAVSGAPPALQTAGSCNRNKGVVFELPDICGSSPMKPEVASSGFPIYILERIAESVFRRKELPIHSRNYEGQHWFDMVGRLNKRNQKDFFKSLLNEIELYRIKLAT